MSSAPLTLRGTVSPLDGGPCRIAILDSEEQEWPVFPRGAGTDLAERVGSPVEVLCTTMEDGVHHQIYVRSYKFLDEDEAWL